MKLINTPAAAMGVAVMVAGMGTAGVAVPAHAVDAPIGYWREYPTMTGPRNCGATKHVNSAKIGVQVCVEKTGTRLARVITFVFNSSGESIQIQTSESAIPPYNPEKAWRCPQSTLQTGYRRACISPSYRGTVGQGVAFVTITGDGWTTLVPLATGLVKLD